MFKSFAVTAGFALVALPVLAGAQQAPPTVEKPAEPAAKSAPKDRDPNRQVCTMKRPVGSRIRVRECKTQVQADQDTEDARRIQEKTRGMKEQEIIVELPGGG